MPELEIRDVNTIFGFWASRPIDVSIAVLCESLTNPILTFCKQSAPLQARLYTQRHWRSSEAKRGKPPDRHIYGQNTSKAPYIGSRAQL